MSSSRWVRPMLVGVIASVVGVVTGVGNTPAAVAGACPVTNNTPSFTIAYGGVLMSGANAPIGAVVEARTPRETTAGCFVVGQAGSYGAMYIYGEDSTVTPSLPGMRAGEAVAFYVNGFRGTAKPPLVWANDLNVHAVDIVIQSAPPTGTNSPTFTPTSTPGSGSGGGGTGGGSGAATPMSTPSSPLPTPVGVATPESRNATFSALTGGTLNAGSVQIQVPAGVVAGGDSISVQVDPVTADTSASQQTRQALAALRLPPMPEGSLRGSQLFSVRVLDAHGEPVAELARPLFITNQMGNEDVRLSGNQAAGLSLARLDATANTWVTLDGTADLGARQVTASTARSGVLALMVRIPPASLREPAEGFLSVDLAPTLIWQVPANAVWHQVQVLPAKNDGPAINLILGAPELVVAGQYAVPAPKLGVGNYVMLPGMSYAWRVRMSTVTAAMTETSPGWSSWASRTFRTGSPTSATIGPVNPAPGANVTSLTPQLSWSNSNDRIYYYEVQISQDPDFETDPARAMAAVYWELVHGGQASPPNSYQVKGAYSLQASSQYHWRVRPRVQGDGNLVNWSSVWSFRTP